MNVRRVHVVDVDDDSTGPDEVTADDREVDDIGDHDVDDDLDVGDEPDVGDDVAENEDSDDRDAQPADDGVVEAAPEVAGRSTVPTSHPRVSEALRYLLDRYGMTSATDFPAAIAVVSALRKEGVTTVSQSLAEVLSVDFGFSVCWVDVSWAEGAPTPQRGLLRRFKRRRSRSSGGSRSPGLLDVVGGASTLDEVIRTSSETELAHLGAGSTAVPLREVTRSIEIQDVLDELMARYEIVVFDSAPVADNSAALSLIQYAKAYVLVTQHGSTTAQQVSSATELLDPVPVMGAVLNGYRSRTPRMISRFFATDQ